MLVCWPVGLIVGLAAQHVVTDHIQQHMARHPMPPDDLESGDADRRADDSTPAEARGGNAA